MCKEFTVQSGMFIAGEEPRRSSLPVDVHHGGYDLEDMIWSTDGSGAANVDEVSPTCLVCSKGFCF